MVAGRSALSRAALRFEAEQAHAAVDGAEGLRHSRLLRCAEAGKPATSTGTYTPQPLRCCCPRCCRKSLTSCPLSFSPRSCQNANASRPSSLQALRPANMPAVFGSTWKVLEGQVCAEPICSQQQAVRSEAAADNSRQPAAHCPGRQLAHRHACCAVLCRKE